MCIRDSGRLSEATSGTCLRFSVPSGDVQRVHAAEKCLKLPEAAPRLALGALVVRFGWLSAALFTRMRHKEVS
eukprot:8511509-Alexandrium_andersonii.AAC.1